MRPHHVYIPDNIIYERNSRISKKHIYFPSHKFSFCFFGWQRIFPKQEKRWRCKAERGTNQQFVACLMCCKKVVFHLFFYVRFLRALKKWGKMFNQVVITMGIWVMFSTFFLYSFSFKHLIIAHFFIIY